MCPKKAAINGHLTNADLILTVLTSTHSSDHRHSFRSYMHRGLFCLPLSRAISVGFASFSVRLATVERRSSANLASASVCLAPILGQLVPFSLISLVRRLRPINVFFRIFGKKQPRSWRTNQKQTPDTTNFRKLENAVAASGIV